MGILNHGVALDKACSPVKVQVNVLDVPAISKVVMEVLFTGLFMDTRDKDNPALHSCRDIPCSISVRVKSIFFLLTNVGQK